MSNVYHIDAGATDESGQRDSASDTHGRSSAAGQGQTGLRALAAVGRHLGLDFSIERLLHVYGREKEPSTEHLAQIARDENLKSAAHRLDWERLVNFRAAVPFLARLDTGAYVVVLQTPAQNMPGMAAEPSPSILIFNPRVPEHNVYGIARADFEAHWTGEIVLLRRVYKFNDAKQPFGLGWFVPRFWKQRGLFANIAVAALAMHALSLAVPIFFQIVIDKVLVHFAVQTLAVIGIGVLLAILFDASLSWLRGYFLLRASSRIDIGLARTTFQHLMGLPISFFEHSLAGVVTKHMQQGSQIREFLTGRLLGALLDLPALFIFLPVLIYYSSRLTLVVLGVTLVLALVITVMIRPYRRRLRRLYTAEAGRQSLLVETIHGMRTVKSLNLEPRRQEAWETASANSVNTYIDVGKLTLAANTLSQFIDKALTVVIVTVGAFLVFSNHMSVGSLVAFNMLATRVTSPILQLIGLLNNYQEVLMSVEMLGEVMNRPIERPNERGLTPSLRGDIQIDNVTFSYSDRDVPALRNLSVHFPAGAMIGIVGRSGSGKTTLSSLLQGLYVATEGAIRVDGHNLRDIDLAFLRGQTGVVPQDPFLFHGTVKENIRMGSPTASFEEIVEAARLAGASEFIEQLPQRYDTMIEESAVNLSGGQRQRISIARALLRKPRIIIFDEATSALDPESEAVVVANLRHMAKGRTAIVISHRLRTIRDADIILVLDNGALSGTGSHSDLMQRNAIYRALWAQQSATAP